MEALRSLITEGFMEIIQWVPDWGKLQDIRYQLQLPLFDGKNPREWILEMEEYFQLFRLREEEEFRAACVALDGEAWWWFGREHLQRPFYRWEELKALLVLRFGSSPSSWWEQPTPMQFLNRMEHQNLPLSHGFGEPTNLPAGGAKVSGSGGQKSGSVENITLDGSRSCVIGGLYGGRTRGLHNGEIVEKSESGGLVISGAWCSSVKRREIGGDDHSGGRRVFDGPFSKRGDDFVDATYRTRGIHQRFGDFANGYKGCEGGGSSGEPSGGLAGLDGGCAKSQVRSGGKDGEGKVIGCGSGGGPGSVCEVELEDDGGSEKSSLRVVNGSNNGEKGEYFLERGRLKDGMTKSWVGLQRKPTLAYNSKGKSVNGQKDYYTNEVWVVGDHSERLMPKWAEEQQETGSTNINESGPTLQLPKVLRPSPFSIPSLNAARPISQPSISKPNSFPLFLKPNHSTQVQTKPNLLPSKPTLLSFLPTSSFALSPQLTKGLDPGHMNPNPSRLNQLLSESSPPSNLPPTYGPFSFHYQGRESSATFYPP